jgi:hypothetical protein
MVMQVPDGAGGPGGGDDPRGDLPPWPGAAGASWRGWASDVAVVLRRGWRVIAAILLVTMALPVLVLSGLIADSVAVGAAVSLNGQESMGTLVGAALTAPVVLVLAVFCGLVVAHGWTGAAWAATSAGSGRPASLRDALRWSWRRVRLLWGSYMIGVAILTGAGYLAGYAGPQAFAVPDLLVLAGPAGLLAPVLSFAPAATWRRRAPGAGGPPAADGAPAATGRRACLAPMALVLAAVMGCEVAAALAMSWLMSSPPAVSFGVGLDGSNGPDAVLIASLVALPGSVLLVAASSVSYARLRARRERLTQLP